MESGCCYGEGISLDEIDEMEKKLENIRLEIEKSENELASIKNEQSYTQSAIEYSISLIQGYTEYCITLNAVISEYDVEIEEIKNSIEIKQKEFDEIYDVYLKRLQYKKEEGQLSIIGLILNSDSLAEFLISLERANEAIRYDRELLEKVNKQKEDLENEMASLSNMQADRQNQIDQYEELKVKISQRIDQLYSFLKELDSSFADKEEEKNLWEKMEEEADKAVKELIDAYLKQNASTPSYAMGETIRWPLDSKWSYISSPYGYRTHPITGEKYSFHGAIDIPASGGENIYAALSGTVVTATYNSSYGNYIIIDHGIISSTGQHFYTLYAHSSELLVEKGEKVNQGDIIAKVGETGSAKGNHLHFEIRLDSQRVDPLKYVDVP